MTWDELKAILDKGDAKACLKLLENTSEKERQAVAKSAFEWFKKIDKEGMVQVGPGQWSRHPLLDSAEIALCGCASISQLKECRHWIPSEAYEIMSARRPPWINEWAELILQWSPANHSLVRRLVRDGLCRRPTNDNYLLGLLNLHDDDLGRFGDVRKGMLADPDFLEDDLWKLFEIEGGGEYSLANRDKFAHKPENRWSDSLVQLAYEEKLPRDRLLDASLDALERDFAQYRAGWFSRFHEALKPTLDERAARTKRYLALLGSRIPPTVSFALKAISQLEKAKRLSPELVVEHIGPALFARAKGTVLAGVGLLSRAVANSPQTSRAAVHLAATALGHDSVEVQKAALELIQKYGDRSDGELSSLINERADQVAASLRPRVVDWLGASEKPKLDSKPQPEERDLKPLMKRARAIDPEFARLAGIDVAIKALKQGGGPIPALTFDGTEIPRLDPDKKIRPIEDLDELIYVFAATLENPGNLDEVERVLDGVSRLCDQKPSDFASHTGPLRKRAFTLMKRTPHAPPFSDIGNPHDLYGLALSWTTGEALAPEILPGKKDESRGIIYQYPASWQNWQARLYRVHPVRTVNQFISQRLWKIAQRAALGNARPLLSAPTHAGGWIDARILVDRLSQCQKMEAELDNYDEVQSLLRLPPDHRKEALRKTKRLKGEFADAVRYALGDDQARIGPTAALWVSAARARSPLADDPKVESRHANFGPDAGISARYHYSVKLSQHTYEGKTYSNHIFNLHCEPKMPKGAPRDLPTVSIHGNCNPRCLVWPLARESYFAAGALEIGRNLDWWEAQWENRLYLEPLLDPDVPMKPMALLLLVLGLAAKEPGEHGLATDALIATIDDGRVAADNLGNMLGSLLPTGLVLAKRYAKTLGEAARVSELHAYVVIGAIIRALSTMKAVIKSGSTPMPRDLQSLLEFLHELLASSGETITDSEARKHLQEMKASGKTAGVIKSLIALPERPSRGHRMAAATRALTGRIERAERWMRWRKGAPS
jgi:hypothetical protein